VRWEDIPERGTKTSRFATDVVHPLQRLSLSGAREHGVGTRVRARVVLAQRRVDAAPTQPSSANHRTIGVQRLMQLAMEFTAVRRRIKSEAGAKTAAGLALRVSRAPRGREAD
jgi:hypothetical protein